MEEYVFHMVEKSIGAIHNWHGKPVWEHYQIVSGKAVKIAHDTFQDLMKSGSTINQPLYAEDPKDLIETLSKKVA